MNNLIDLLEPDSATNVLDNFQTIFENVGDQRYEEAYTGLFEDEFEFLPDESDRQTYSIVYATQWLKDREEIFGRRLFEKDFLQGVEVETWSVAELERAGDVEKHELICSATFDYVNAELAVNGYYPKTLKGTARLFLRERNGAWAIFRWEDQKTDVEAASWGGVRAVFSP